MNAAPRCAGADPCALLREDLRDFAGYRSARSEALQGRIWLNANESPWANAGDAEGALRRYPDPQPTALRAALAELYGCAPEELLVGRGSDEGIDLLVRALCRPGADAILVTSPTFGMYAVSARLHGTAVVDVPLRDTVEGFACDFDAVAAAALARPVKLVFLCSPGNPSGTLLPLDGIVALARRLEGRALVVVDEAYLDFAQAPSAVDAIPEQPNLAVLRTLSKAHALAAARIGCVVAAPGLVDALRRCQAPYPLPAACVAQALAALARPARAATAARAGATVREREALAARLAALPGVRRVYPSRANFLLVRFADAQAAFERLLAAGVVVRDMRAAPALGDALRISLGTPAQNAAALAALAGAAA
ncbi:histidinol-phosphate aminotransferase [Vulcaniibacterium tengchongense]|uniref:Histidinol-phosphate aminotransferase n=2 Tax=Vulcaniibacterium tengchongense TaxID=1273429 RepID=A0A3N4VGX0_9GAMM|nr:histidinol-phosphate transaminase [Vulcaniibacterium tengchongense]RPE82008.1 histidinol-phosphate aminotransferase [Vulcaniibacterium tengchongense]